LTEDLHRTNINLNAADVEWLQKAYGRGWTERVRGIVNNYVRQAKGALGQDWKPRAWDDTPETLRPQIVRGKEY
jgi:hypothetical protein